MLRLFNIENFINFKQIKKVMSAELPVKNYNNQGLWDENIFGHAHSRDRNHKFGYIELNCEIITPICFNMVKTLSPEISRCILEKEKYIYEPLLKKLIVDKEKGQNGISFIISLLRRKDFDIEEMAVKEKKEVARYLKENMSKIIISKFLVLPPGGIRDIILNSESSRKLISEVNDYYKSLIFFSSKMSKDPVVDAPLVKKVQEISIQIMRWVFNELKGKRGLFRNSILKKTMDYTSRIVLGNDPNIPVGSIGLPWHTLIVLYEPLFTYHLFKEETEENQLIKENIVELLGKKDSDISVQDILIYVKTINKGPEKINKRIKNILIEKLKIILKDEIVMYKRDPVIDRHHWLSGSIVITEGNLAYVNTLNLNQMGGDSDGDTIEIVPIFTKEAKEQSKKLNPELTKSRWADISNYSSESYKLSLDVVSTIFYVTRDK